MTPSIFILSLICLCQTACTRAKSPVFALQQGDLHSTLVLFCHTAVSVYFLPPYGCVLPRRCWLLHQHHMARPTRQAAHCKTPSVTALCWIPERSAKTSYRRISLLYVENTDTYKLIQFESGSKAAERLAEKTRMSRDSLENRWYIHLLLAPVSRTAGRFSTFFVNHRDERVHRFLYLYLSDQLNYPNTQSVGLKLEPEVANLSLNIG